MANKPRASDRRAFPDRTKAELAALLRARNMPAGGTKDEMVARLRGRGGARGGGDRSVRRPVPAGASDVHMIPFASAFTSAACAQSVREHTSVSVDAQVKDIEMRVNKPEPSEFAIRLNGTSGPWTTFRSVRVLGEGGFGRVLEFATGDGRRLAVKVGHTRGDIDADVDVSELLRDAPCQTVRSVPVLVENAPPAQRRRLDDMFIVMESFAGTLDALMLRVSARAELRTRAASIVRSLASSLACLLTRKLYYMDLKPANILIRCPSPGMLNIVLGDVGSLCDRRMSGRDCAMTDAYLPRVKSNLVNTEADIVYTLGLLYAQMLAFAYANGANHNVLDIVDVPHGRRRSAMQSVAGIPTDERALVYAMLNNSATLRPTLRAVMDRVGQF